MTAMKPLALILISALALVAARVLADAAPQEAVPGSGILPSGTKTQVRMVAETVRLALQPNWTSEDTELEAKVSAVFTMQNLGRAAETMQVRFPVSDTYGGYSSGRIVDFKVQVDGKALGTTIVHTPNPVDATLEPVLWAGFPVSFAPGKNVRISVAYSLESTTYANLEHFGYILETGRGWNGTIGSAEIIVTMPYPSDGDALVNASKYLEYLNTTPGAGQRGNEFRWRWQNLEPTSKDNFSLTVVAPSKWRAVWLAKQRVKLEPNVYDAWTRLGVALHEVSAGKFGESALSAARDRAFAQALKLAKTAQSPRQAEADVHMAMLENNDQIGSSRESLEVEPWYTRLLEVLRLDSSNTRAEEFFDQLQGFADAMPSQYRQLTFPLLAPRAGSPGAVAGLDPGAVVKALAIAAQLGAGNAERCGAEPLIEARLNGSGFKREQTYGYTLPAPRADDQYRSPEQRLEAVLEAYGRSWITPYWEYMGRDYDLYRSYWRFFSNLDGSRRYGVSVQAVLSGDFTVCIAQYVKR